MSARYSACEGNEKEEIKETNEDKTRKLEGY
jgi:hypothetical protein